MTTSAHRLRARFVLPALVFLSCIQVAPAQSPQAGPGAPPAPATFTPQQLLAHRLDQLARRVLAPPGSGSAPVPARDSRAALARTLLHRAAELDPQNAELWRLLLEADAQSTAQQIRALTRYVQLAPQDDWAQLRLVQALADQAQTVEQRVAIYQNVLSGPGSEKLSPALRSRVAVIAAGLKYQQTDLAGYIALIKQAIALDDTNRAAAEAALRFLQQQSAPRGDVAQAMLNLVAAAPADPSVHVQLARMLLDCGQYALAVNWYESAARIASLQGHAPVADVASLLCDEAMSFWGAGRATDALRLIDSVTHSPQAAGAGAGAPHLAAPRLLMIAIAIQQEQGRSDVAGETFEKLEAEVRRAAAADPDSPGALSDLIWPHLLFNRDVAATEPLMKKLRELGPDPQLQQRLEGWWLLRTGNKAEAKKILAGCAERDVYCRLGLFYADADTLDKNAQIDRLNPVFAQDPGELAGVIAAARIASLGGRPIAAPDCQAVGRMAQQLPRDFQQVATEPRRFVMMRIKPVRSRVGFAQPVEVELELTNVWDAAMSLGAGQTLSGTVVLTPVVTTATGQKLAMSPTVVDLSRRIRLDPRESLTVRTAVDHGSLGEYLAEHPTETVRVTVFAVLNPRLTNKGQVVPGLLGVNTSTRTIERTGWDVNAEQLVAAKLSEIGGPDGAAAMQAAALVARVAPSLPAEKQDVAQRMADALNAAFKRFSPVEQAWTGSYLPSVPAVRRLFEPTIDAALNSPDATVQQLTILALGDAPDSVVLTSGLRSPDAQVKQFAQELKQVLSAPAKPAAPNPAP